MTAAVREAAPPTSEERLMAAAEALIYARGYHAVRTRALADRAGMQMAMIRYCFGGVDELMTRLLQLNLDRFIAAQSRMMAELGPDASRRDILRAMLAPIDIPAAFTPDIKAAMVVEDIIVHAGEDMARAAELRLHESFLPLLERLAATCPHLPWKSVVWRFSCLCEGALGMSPRSPAWQLYRSITHSDPATGAMAQEELLAMACGAFD